MFCSDNSIPPLFYANFGYIILVTYFRNDPFVTVASYLSGMYQVNSPSTNEARWVDDGAVHGILDTVDLRGNGELVEWRSYNSRLGA